MIPAWLDLRSFILGVLAAYILSIVVTVVLCKLRGFADWCAYRRRGQREAKRIEQFEERRASEDAAIAESLVEWVSTRPDGRATEHMYHRFGVTHDED